MTATAADAATAVPNPQPAAPCLDPERSASRRKLDCLHAGACLGRAADAEWPAMSCAGCGAYLAPDIEQQVADAGGLLALRRAAGRGQRRAPRPSRARIKSNEVAAMP